MSLTTCTRTYALIARRFCCESYFKQRHSYGTFFSKELSRPVQSNKLCKCRNVWNTRRYFRSQNVVGRKGHSPEMNGPHQRRFGYLVKPFGFAMTVSGCSFAGAAIWQYESMRELFRHTPDEERLFGHFAKVGSWREYLNSIWYSMSSGHRVIAAIIAVNCGVFGLWLMPPLRGVMMKWFTSNPMSAAPCWSMLLSSFSHYSFIHLFVNMYVLWSFAPTITRLLGKEQFTAMYLSGGVLSALASYAMRVAQLSMVPSLGASGAIMAVLGAVCYCNPETQLTIAFVGDVIPHSFSAKKALYALITFDSLGILLRWRFFDHAAHLGGVLFGLWYVAYGHEMIWKRREPLMKKWHDFRGKP